MSQSARYTRDQLEPTESAGDYARRCLHTHAVGTVAYELQEDGTTLASFDCKCGDAIERVIR